MPLIPQTYPWLTLYEYSIWLGKEQPVFQIKSRDPWSRKWQHHTPVFLPGKSHGKRSLVVYIPVHFSLVTQPCPTLYNPIDCSTPGFPVHRQLPERAQTHVHQVNDAIQPSHSLLSPTPPAFNLSQHQGLFKWVSSSHQVAKVLEYQL